MTASNTQPMKARRAVAVHSGPRRETDGAPFMNRMPCPSLEQETPAWGQHGSRTQAGTITSQPTAARPGIPRPAASMRARWAFIFPDLPLSCGEAWLQ